ncbi:MAG: tetratricopeptide repeat protein [Bacteroidetes bacterium]|nr:tetratricopeptide repeat protein [Bacteroidota bacterium]
MSKGTIWGVLALIMIAVGITYSNHFQGSLHFDDAHTIENNAYIRDLKNIPLFFKDGTTSSSLPPNQSYRPVLTTTLAIDYHFSDDLKNMVPFHVTSFTFFMLLGVLMFVLFSRILDIAAFDDKYRDWAALFAVAWFMLHPVCAETINYIIQRGDSLSTFFVVLGLVMYAVSPVSRKFFLYLIPVVLGILTKPSALMFGPLLVCYMILFDGDAGYISILTQKSKALGKMIVPAAVTLVVCVAGYLFVSHMQPKTYVEGQAETWMYRLTQPYIIFYYFTAWFAPVHLNADTDWVIFRSAADPYALLGYAFLLFTVILIIITSEHKVTRPIAFGLSWFLLANVPTSLIAFSEVTNDHRMFFPFVGLSLAIVWSLYLIVRLVAGAWPPTAGVKWTFYAFIIVLLTGYAYGTHTRNEVWKNDETLWYDCTVKSPTNGRGLMNYGLALMRRGDLAGAERYYSRGLEYWPNYAYLNVNMAILKETLGKKEEAENYFKAGVYRGGNLYPGSYYYYARFLKSQGRNDEAIKMLNTVLDMSGANLDSRYMLMELLYRQKRYEELKKVAGSTLAISPSDAQATRYLQLASSGKSMLDIAKETAETTRTADNYLNLSLQYYNAGDYQGCVNAAQKALELKPDYAPAYNNIGSAYNIMKKYKEARAALLRATALDPTSQLAKNNLAVAEKGLKEQK